MDEQIKYYQVKHRCVLRYPNTELWARPGDFIRLDANSPVHHRLMVGQWHCVVEVAEAAVDQRRLREVDQLYQREHLSAREAAKGELQGECRDSDPAKKKRTSKRPASGKSPSGLESGKQSMLTEENVDAS